MLQQIANYAHMPAPFTVFGILFAIYAAFVLIRTIREGYFNGIFIGIIDQLHHRYKIFLTFIIFLFIIIYFVDLLVAKLCQSWYNIDVYTILDFINSMGEGWFIIGVLFTLSIINEFLSKSNNAVILKISYVAAAYAGIFNAVLKFIFNRQRPSIGLEPYNFFYFFISGDKKLIDLTYAYNSMPSGHTITVFAAIIPLILYIKSPLYRLLLLSFATAVAIARIYTMNHWFSDICVSVVLGVIIGLAIYRTNVDRIRNVV
ncbi:MAG TPA: phosphatase PAP2 family protein [Aquella sp.]|nr:phosphatase PAP2 family protein [Aquella sp.]